MKCDDYESPTFVNALHNAPYITTMASAPTEISSLSSAWSDAYSQHSDDSASSGQASDSDSPANSSQSSVSSSGSSCEPALQLLDPWRKQLIRPAQPELPLEPRQNPRRTSSSATSRTGCPPSLVRQADRKLNFVDTLVDSSTHIVEAIWPTSSVINRNENGNNTVLPLRTFIQETLRRSRTSYSTLQVALYYLVLIKSHVPEHDFTMEQPYDNSDTQAVQCGRRMFLAALILASKYLQDRNYSARAWSKISGLTTTEINQNEMSFLLAVDWKLHITDDVYNRWTECVMKYTPSQPSSPGGAAQLVFERQCEAFRKVILRLTPELDNLDGLVPVSPTLSHEVPRSLFTPPNERVCPFGYDGELTSASKSHGTPSVMEPTPATVYTPGRFAPALGLLPTPRLTPQSTGFSTPAVSAASYSIGRGSSMGFAMAQASATVVYQSLDRWSPSAASSPLGQFTRRYSLANSVSTASSPESMVSDSSRVSRSSSIYSASSLVSAPSAKLDVQARCRYAKQCSERFSLRPTIASVPEDYEENCLTASPLSYTGTVGKDFCDVSMETPLGRRQREMDDAARALQDLQRHGARQAAATEFKIGSKRSRPVSTDNSLQENVRELLTERYLDGVVPWTDVMVQRSRTDAAQQAQQPLVSFKRGRRKRVCYSADEAEAMVMPALHPAFGGFGGPGMWSGILN
ncbi:hypothetical protein B0T22DRAFT_58196 [Podospora appendiculata]|uniref:G1/S-specific cyclin pas1 n=1 Tax=Podospora appendiculata TaxID=314037 RepID=A0AAE0XIU9_9PEZI|nr:hypothetical protein B0T22DRAFT_58196 [Podospora appendiculata]